MTTSLTDSPRRWWHATAAIAVATALAVGCTSSTPEPNANQIGPNGTVELGDVTLIAALQRFNSCDAFLADMKAEALERVGPYGLNGGSGWGGVRAGLFGGGEDDGVFTEAAGDMTRAPVPDSAAPTTTGDGFSGTNIQELGVDEPDIIKTDGELVAAVSQGRLHLIDASDPANPVALSSNALAGYGADLLLHGDTLVVLQQVGQYWDVYPTDTLERDGAIGAPAGSSELADDMPNSGRGFPGPYPMSELMTVTQLDISNPSSPAVEETWTVEGRYVSARLVDGVARIVVRSTAATSLPFVYPSGPQAEEAATTANQAVIEASTVEDWIANLTVEDGNGNVTSESTVAPCDQVYRPSVFSGFGMVTVLTADLGGSGLGEGSGVGVVSSGETVYATPTSLYVATNQWVAPDEASSMGEDRAIMPRPSGTERTDVHQFAIENAEPARYLASGSVDGRVLNQFSMSEHNDHLRIAVTEGSWDPDSASSVVILARSGETLAPVGSVGDLGKGEQIYAVRFMGDKGYVVTFRQIDPLYTLDLSDPTNPRMLGELKIPGFSSYLHPVGEDLLIGIGQDATDEGMATGSQVSLFDVSNPADPQRVAQLDLGEGTNSEVEYDHRAFLFWDGVAVLPFMSYTWGPNTESMSTGAVAVDIDDEARTLDERGRITHSDQPTGAIGSPTGSNPEHWDRNYQSQIRRSLVIGDTLITLSDRGLLASDLASLEPGTWLSLGG